MRYSYDQKFFSYFKELERRFYAMPVRLGGNSVSVSGSWGGSYLGYVGYLPQNRVGYDSDELASSGFLYSGSSLVDNLNHIRYRIDALEHYSGLSSPISVYDDDVLVTEGVTILNFGTNLSVVDNGNGDVTINATTAEVTISGSLNDLTDVNITSPSNTSFLIYDSATSNWIDWKPSTSQNVIMYWDTVAGIWATDLVTTLFDAGDITVDTTSFNGNLSSADDTIQKALNTIDNIVLGSGTGGGAVNFVDLGDVPASYTGQANKAVKVKNDETGLEFFTLSSYATWHQTVYVDKYGNGDFVTVKSACDYVSTQTRTDPWVIYILPGEYDEDPFTIPSNTHLMGATQPAYITKAPVKINFSATSGILITMNSDTAIDYVELYWNYVILTGPTYFIKTNGAGYCTLRTCTIGLEPETASNTDQVTAFWASASGSVLFMYNVDIDDRITSPTANTEVSLFRSQNSTGIEIRNTTVQVQTNNHYTGILYNGNISLWNSFIGDRFDTRGTGTVRVFGQWGVNHYGYDVDSSTGLSDVVWLGETNATLLRGKQITDGVVADNNILVYSTATGKWELGTNTAGATQLTELSDVDIILPSTGQLLYYDGAKWVNSTISIADLVPSSVEGDMLIYTGGIWDTIATTWIVDKLTYDGNNDGVVNAADVAYSVTASNASVNTSTFNKNLSALDNTVQKALETLDNLDIGSGSGSNNFIELLDVPNSYTGQAGKTLRVNNSEDGLEFVTTTSGSSMTPLYYKWDADAPPVSANANDDEFDDDSIAAGWTDFDPGSTQTESEGDFGLVLTQATHAGNGITGKYISLPSAPFSMISKINVSAITQDQSFAAIVLWENAGDTSKKVLAIGMRHASVATSPDIFIRRYSAYNGTATNIAVQAVPVLSTYIYIRIRYVSSTDIKADYSFDGITFKRIFSGDPLIVPTSIGIGVNNLNTGEDMQGVFRFVRFTNSDVGLYYPCYGRKMGVYE